MNKYASILLLSALTLVAGCTMEESLIQEEKQTVGNEITIQATRESEGDPETRTMRDESDGSVWWTPGDAISLFYGSGTDGGSKFTSNATEISKVANFTGVITAITGGGEISLDATYFWGVYPYREDVSCDGNSVTMTIPSQQNAVPGSFATDLFPSIGRSRGLIMGFYNVCGGWWFSVTKEGINKVILKSKNGEAVTGKVKVGFDDSGVPEVREVINGSDEVVLECPAGEYFEVGKKYYIVLLPDTFSSGFTMTLETDTGTGVYDRTASTTIKRSKFSGFDNLDNYCTFSPKPNVIYYTSIDDEIVKPTTSDYFYGASKSIDVFGANIVSNDYVNGQGVISFDDEVKFIGSNAFDQIQSSNLETITLPQSVATIGPGAFYNSSSHLNHFYGKYSSQDGRCLVDDGRVLAFAPSGLTDYTLPEGIRIIGTRSVESKELRTVVIPEGVTTIEDQAFYYSSNVESAVLPQTLEFIGDRSIPFGSYSIPSGVTHIGILSGPYLADLNSTTPPEIVEDTFGETSIYWIYVPQGTGETYRTAWPDYASRIREKGIQPLNEIWYTTVDGNPLTTNHENHNITANWKQKLLSNENGKMVFDAPITRIGDFFEQSNVLSISFPDAMTLPDGQGTFLYCNSLEEVHFGEYCSIIPGMCFYGCDSIENVTLPPNVTVVGQHLFYNCPALRTLTVLATTPPKEYTLFSGTTNKETLIYVPEESIEAYKNAEDWSTYADRILAIPTN